MKYNVTGGCHCGSIRYSAEIDKLEAVYCHCRMCQKSFGNIFATFFSVFKSDVRWITKEPAYFHSSKLAKRGFCPDCGTPISFGYHDSDHIDLSVGSLDKPEQMKPVSHFGVESRLIAFHKPDDLPETRTEDGKNYVTKWKEIYGEESDPGPIFQPSE